MPIQKLSGSEEPALIEVLSVQKSGYRTGKRYEIRIRCTWDHAEAARTWTWYQDDAMVEFDRDTETMTELKAKVKTVYADLKAQDKADANLVYTLEHATLEP